MNPSTNISGADDQAGSVLLVLLIVVCLASIVMASLSTATIEWSVASTNASNLQAFAAAESGLEHAFVFIGDSGIDFDDYLVGDDGQKNTADDGRIFDTPVVLGDSTYSAVMTDNDDGDGDPFKDADGLVEITSTGQVGEVIERTWAEFAIDENGDLVVLSWRSEG